MADTEIRKIIDNIERVIVGKRGAIELVLASLLSEGHVLIEDVPGTGKTMLARSMARSIDAAFRRIQFTPDLLPTDVTGVNIYNMKAGDFEFKPGPVFAHIVLADEINRASPRTQSALLECMEETNVSVDGVTYRLNKPFMVIATQNPIELAGTYPLPEAQLDRFLMKIAMGYPDRKEEARILTDQQQAHPVESISTVTGVDAVRALVQEVKRVNLSDEVKAYIVAISDATRHHPDIALGVSPRGSLALMKSARAFAYIGGRPFVGPDDVKVLAPYVLSHRIHLRPGLVIQERRPEDVVAEILAQVPVPVMREA